MSNALLVGADRTDTGHPLVVFGPQTGYFTPQLLTEISLRGPGIAARGVSFAGTQLIVELGHGVDYAWSATSASSDLVDTVVERLCSTTGGPVGLDADGYLQGGACTKFDSYVHEQTVVPTAAGMGPPARVRMLVERTVHGIVQERTTVAGRPVAVVLDRSTYGQELDSAVGFARINDPDFTKDAPSFARAFAGVDYTFNWFYADDRDIAFYSSGLLPVRAAGHNPDLPRWGDTAFDWTGFVADADHPYQANPPSGFLSSWNNKPAPAFSAADGTWGYGPVYRSLLLDKRVQALMAAGTVTRTRAGRAGGRRRRRRPAGRGAAAAAARRRRHARRPGAGRGGGRAARLDRRPAARGPRPRRRLHPAGGDRAVRRVVGAGRPRRGPWPDRAAQRPGTAGRRAAQGHRRPPAAGPGLGVERRRLVRLRLEGAALGARPAGDRARSAARTAGGSTPAVSPCAPRSAGAVQRVLAEQGAARWGR
jgi:hypothetical protein